MMIRKGAQYSKWNKTRIAKSQKVPNSVSPYGSSRKITLYFNNDSNY